MWILILGLIALTVSGIAYEDAHFSVSSLEEGNRLNLEAENQAHLFELYREAVNAYAAGNPEFSGTVPEGELALPAGMIVPPGFSNSVSGGVAYAWISPGKGVSPDGILGALSGISDGSVLVGMKQGGVLVSPILGNTGISLPSEIPEGSAVSMEETTGPVQTFGGTPTWPQHQSLSSSTSAYDGTTRNVCLGYSYFRCDRCFGSGRRRRCYRTTCSYCSDSQTQYQWASYSCTNYDWIFQPGGSPSDPSSSCTITNTWWENSP
ncbi:type IV pilus biogenesis protein PilM [Leptospirillum ferriphilum]|uniref:type IV pilus biogenesis protein PilM n=1 Tax=Leptospirillum ferriphilum TaxID=178606 RepID=UPI003EE59213